MASRASSSVSTTWSMRPVISACRRQPPRSSRSTSSPIAMETRRGLETAIVEPLRMTTKSEQQASQADEPNDGPSAAATHGDSRVRRNWVGSLPSREPMPPDPMASGSRAPVDSPIRTQRHATLGGGALHMGDLLAVGGAGRSPHDGEVVDDEGDVAAVDAGIAGDLAVGGRLVAVFGENAGGSRRVRFSTKLPSSTRRSTRWRALRTPAARRLASFSGPPMASALRRRSSSSARRSSWPMANPRFRQGAQEKSSSAVVAFAHHRLEDPVGRNARKIEPADTHGPEHRFQDGSQGGSDQCLTMSMSTGAGARSGCTSVPQVPSLSIPFSRNGPKRGELGGRPFRAAVKTKPGRPGP